MRGRLRRLSMIETFIIAKINTLSTLLGLAVGSIKIS
jgi:hypothetical protein